MTAPTATDAPGPELPAADPPARQGPRRGGARSLLVAGVYSFGFAIQRALGLIMLPLYTRAIAPSDYGALGILVASASVAWIFYSVALETPLLRQYFQLAGEPERRQVYIDSLWRFQVVYPLILTAVLTAVAWSLLPSSRRVDTVDVFFMLLSTAIGTAAVTVPLTVLRAREDLRGYLIMTAVTGIGTPALTVLFVVALDSGILGWFLASSIANALAFVVALRLIPWNFRGRVSRPVLKAAILFSLPLLPHMLSHVALQLADRGVIATMVSSADLGTYTLAANFGVPLMMLVFAVYQGFSPIYARAGAEKGMERELAQTVVVQIGAVIGLTLAGLLLAPPGIRALTPAAYHGAASIVGWILLGYGFLGLYFVPMSGAGLGAGRTRFVWVASGLSAAVNVGLLFAFVPTHGIRAAAIASAVGYFALLVLMATWAHSGPNPVRYRWGPILTIVATAGATWLASRATQVDDDAVAIAIAFGWLLVFGLVTGLLVFRAQLIRLLQRNRSRGLRHESP